MAAVAMEAQSLSGTIIGTRGPANDATRSFHVWLKDDHDVHDLVIYDHSKLLDALKQRGMNAPSQVYGAAVYESLCKEARQAKDSCANVTMQHEYRVVTGIETEAAH